MSDLNVSNPHGWYNDTSVEEATTAAGSLWAKSGNDIYNTNLHNVGIGVSEPTAKFEVVPDTTTSPEYVLSQTPLLKPFPPPGIPAWSAVSGSDQKFQSELADDLVTDYGSYKAGTYRCFINELGDAYDNSAGVVSDIFQETAGDFRTKTIFDGRYNNRGVAQNPTQSDFYIAFSGPTAFRLRKYFIQAGSWSAAAPFQWDVYGLTGEYGKEGLPDRSQWGSILHSVTPVENVQGVPQYSQYPFGVYTETMRWGNLKWETEDHYDNPFMSRIYSPDSDLLIKTVIFQFKYVSNFAWRTYFDDDGFAIQPYVLFGNTSAKVIIKQNDTAGDVRKFPINIAQIRMFDTIDEGGQLSYTDVPRALVDSQQFGYTVARTTITKNLYVPKTPSLWLDSATFGSDHRSSLLPDSYGRWRSSGGYMNKPYYKFDGLKTQKYINIPAMTLNKKGFSFVLWIKPMSTGTVLTLNTEWETARYFDNFFKWADDFDGSGGIPKFYTFKNVGAVDQLADAEWLQTRSTTFKDSIPNVDTPTPYHFLRITSVNQNGANFIRFEINTGNSTDDTKTLFVPAPFGEWAGIVFKYQPAIAVKQQVQTLYAYKLAASGFQLENKLEIVDGETATMFTEAKTTVFKCNSLGATWKRRHLIVDTDYLGNPNPAVYNNEENTYNMGAEFDLGAFYYYDRTLTTTDQDTFANAFDLKTPLGFSGEVSTKNSVLKVPLSEVSTKYPYDYKWFFNGSLGSDLVANQKVIAASLVAGVSDVTAFTEEYLGEPIAPLHNEGFSYLRKSVGIGAYPEEGTSLIVSGNVSVGGHIVPSGEECFLGNTAAPFKELYLSDNSLHIGDITVSKSNEGLRIRANGELADLVVRDLSAMSITAGTYNNLPAVSWEDLTDTPMYFPSQWDLVGDRPETYPSTWSTVSGKPETYPSTWSLVDEKPLVFPSDWSLVANKPDFTSTVSDGVDASLLEAEFVLCEADVKIAVPVGSVIEYRGTEYIDDPTFIKTGQTVNRADYIELANALGIPKSQTTFTIDTPVQPLVSDIAGDRGSVETYGDGKGGWAGYNIGGEFAFLSNGANWGIWNDVDNKWLIYGDRTHTGLMVNGITRFTTTNDGAYIEGSLQVFNVLSALVLEGYLNASWLVGSIPSHVLPSNDGAVGTYAFAAYHNTNLSYALIESGQIVWGSDLKWANSCVENGTVGWRNQTLNGMWKCMGNSGYLYNGTSYSTSSSLNLRATLWLRTV